MAEENIDDGLENLSGTEKSAILMMLLGEDEAAQVLQKLTPREVQHLGTAMYSVTGVDQTTVNAVLDEFLETIKKQTGIGWALVNTLRMFLQKHLEMTKLSQF
jgi:flagellar motor switch protein FliG